MSKNKKKKADVNEVPAQQPEQEAAAPAPEISAKDSAKDDEIKKLNEEIVKLKDQLLRSLAETENVRRRAQKEVEDSNKYAVTSFARDLVEVLENLYRTRENIPEEALKDNEVLRNISEGIKLTKSELIKTFEKYGIKRISPLGEPFDHKYHQAIVQIESPTAKPGEIVQVIQAGYVMHDRLLRPAMVGVAKPPAEENKENN